MTAKNHTDRNPWRDETKVDGFIVGYGGATIGARKLPTVFATEAVARAIAEKSANAREVNKAAGIEWVQIRHRNEVLMEFRL